MQIKTIERIIKNKLNEWLDTISDEKLRSSVKDNILLSGGSITSMLQNIDVNDYDIYINDMDVLINLCIYYTGGLIDRVEILDGRKRPQLISDLLTEQAVNGVSDLGGIYAISVKNLKEDQVKLYFNEKCGALKLYDKKVEDSGKYIPIFLSPNAISLSDKIQVVLRFHGDNKKIHETFDFIHATNYFTFADGLVTNIRALESILTKQLMYQGSQYPLTTIIRIKKFLKRGWNISSGEMLKVMFQISELDLKNPDVLEEQLIGVDVAYFGKLIEVLRGVDPAKINSPYLNEIIDRVFNQSEEEI